MNKSILTALGIAALISLWLLSGVFADSAPKETVQENQEKQIPKVLVARHDAEDHAKIIRVFGQTQADRDVTLKAETEGKVEEVLLDKGAIVKEGDLIAKLALDDRQSKLRSAQALLRQRQLEFEASKRLSQKSFRSRTQLAEAQANLDDARAQLSQINLDIKHTEIRAPFDGILEDRMIEVGDFVTNGDDLAKILDLDPIVVQAEISETDVFLIQDRQLAEAIMGNGKKMETMVRFIANSTENATRTYKIEVEGANPAYAINAGLTAQLRLKVGKNRAYLVSPSIMTLSDKGEVGLKTVNSQNKVEFHVVRLLEDTSEGIWVAGVPEKARIIMRGQEYVQPGQVVDPVENPDNSNSTETSPAIAQAE